MPVNTGHVAMRTRVQDWTRVRILMGPVITDHWTEAQPDRTSQKSCPNLGWEILD